MPPSNTAGPRLRLAVRTMRARFRVERKQEGIDYQTDLLAIMAALQPTEVVNRSAEFQQFAQWEKMMPFVTAGIRRADDSRGPLPRATGSRDFAGGSTLLPLDQSRTRMGSGNASN